MESKRILGLVGSPRKLGNCEVMTKEISNQIRLEHTLKLIRMPFLLIERCNACYGCIMGKACPHKDDMDFLLDRIAEADGLIISSPVYSLGAHSIFKQVLDRGFLFYRVLEKTFGKPCILLNFFGIKERLGAAPQMLLSFATLLGLDVKASVNIRAALPGEILMAGNTGKQAAKLAASLFSGKVSAHGRGHGCPFCGCEIVRMTGKKFICTLCHGTFRIDEGHRAVPIKDGGMLGDAEHMLLHKKWLSGMKDRFMERRKEILKVSLHYKDMGEWIEP
jgi:multimeric flavodoxin WrbA